ncbi:MAG: exodeoxyribonuclease V subunit alpha, partial [Candidatus Binatia bacterium]
PEAVRAAIPEDASTIHRALGAAPDGSFRYGAERPLVTDAVIVDEASMVDLALMSRLLAAVPDRTRVILLGDRDQLASVEAGSVLADLCGGETGDRVSRFSRRTAAAIRKLTGDEVPEADEPRPVVADAVVHLRENRRFQFAIGTLAAAIQSADYEGALELLRSDRAPETSLISASQSLAARLVPFAVDGYRGYIGERDPEKQLEAFARFRFLCAHRRGADGAESVNALIENALAAEGLIRPSEPNYAGRPLLVTRNDVSTRLFNGDIGLVVQPGSHGRKALFPELGDEARSFRLLSLARLPSVETAFALTIHKSQGSEFDEVVVVLPEKPSRVLTRELLYTAVTRARRRVTIIGAPPIVRHAVEHPTERTSGLRERLWREAGAG